LSPLGLDLVEFGLFAEIHEGSVVIWGVRWHGSDHTGTLGRRHTLHRKDVNLLQDTERRDNLGTDEIGTDNVNELDLLATTLKDTLVGHVASGPFGDQVSLRRRDLENAVLDGWADEAVGLTVPA
jgi:hypothetical protein